MIAMAGPGARELLQAWEGGLHRSPTTRALGLLATTAPGTPVDELALLPIGARDAGLQQLRSALFGDRVEAVCSCPVCGERLEVAFDLRDLPSDDDAGAGDAGPPRRLTLDGHQVAVRPPSSLDLLAVAGEPNLPAALRALLCRCLTVAEDANGGPANSLPEEVAEALASQIEALDPRARIELELGCAGCGHGWAAVFDIAGFLWAELDAWAARTLRDVHTLARAYGWREADILAMSPRRRQAYLELVGA
jgi:hypothetical protein